MMLSLNEEGLFKTDTTKSAFIHLCNKLAQFKCQAINLPSTLSIPTDREKRNEGKLWSALFFGTCQHGTQVLGQNFINGTNEK